MWAIRADPFRESGHAALIRVHLAEGNQSEALRQFATYRELIVDELGWSQRPGFAPWCFRPGDCEPDGSSDELASGELGERAVDTYKFVVRTRLNDAPVLQHENLVRLADGGQAVGDDDPGGTQTHDGVRDLRLRPVVQGAGCLVEKQDPRLGRDCSGDE